MLYYPLNRALIGRSFTFHPLKRCLPSRPSSSSAASSFLGGSEPVEFSGAIFGRNGSSELGNPWRIREGGSSFHVVRALQSERVSVRTECLCSDIEPLWPIATKRDKSDEEPIHTQGWVWIQRGRLNELLFSDGEFQSRVSYWSCESCQKSSQKIPSPPLPLSPEHEAREGSEGQSCDARRG